MCLAGEQLLGGAEKQNTRREAPRRVFFCLGPGSGFNPARFNRFPRPPAVGFALAERRFRLFLLASTGWAPPFTRGVFEFVFFTPLPP